MLTQNNLIAEGSFCNFFWIDELDTIKTPSLSCSILDGVTRNRLLEAASQIGLTVLEGEYDKNELDTCKQAFISSSTRGLLPVKKLHNRNLDIVVLEPITRWMHRFEQLQEESLNL